MVGLFHHLSGVGQAISVAAGPQNIQLQSNTGNSLLLSNLGTKTCYIEFGAVSISTVATTAGMPIAAGNQVVVKRDVYRDLFLSAICGGSDTTTLNVIPGAGESIG